MNLKILRSVTRRSQISVELKSSETGRIGNLQANHHTLRLRGSLIFRNSTYLDIECLPVGIHGMEKAAAGEPVIIISGEVTPVL